MFSKEKIPFCSAVILCAGNSTRMGQNKTFMQLGDQPLIAKTIKAFENCGFIQEIILVTKSESLETLAKLCKDFGFAKVKKVIVGGKERQESSLAGVLSVSDKAKLIAIHDGARPFIQPELIESCIRAAAACKAAVPGVYGVDTLKKVKDGYLAGDVDRSSTVKIQTPQVFDADLIKAALTRAVSEKKNYTDDSSAVIPFGVKVACVPGDSNNIKITSPNDMKLAENILEELAGTELK